MTQTIDRKEGIRRGPFAHAAAWYLRDFPFQRGKGLGNRVIGRFARVTLPTGATVRLTDPLEYSQRVLLFGVEPYEVEGTRLLLNVLRPGMVFVDVGANLGYFSMMASRLVGGTGRVYAFEPAPRTFQHLRLNARTNQAGNVMAVNAALSDAPGTRPLYLSGTWNHGLHSFGDWAGSRASCAVDCTTLDDFVRVQKVTRIDMMKVDVEGAEWLVLRGAARTLSELRPPVIMVELCAEHMRRLDGKTHQVKRLLLDAGYRVYRMEPGGVAAEVDPDSDEVFSNAVAIHGESGAPYLKLLNTGA